MDNDLLKKLLLGFALFIAGTIAIGTVIVIFLMIFGIELPEPVDEKKNQVVNTKSNEKEINDNVDVKKYKFTYNDFVKFTTEYYNVKNSERTDIWESQIKGKRVTWEGYFVEGFNSRLMLYGYNDYKNQDWQELGQQDLYHKSFTAKFKNDIDYNKYQVGDRIKIKGILDSRGSDNPNYHWELHDAEIIN